MRAAWLVLSALSLLVGCGGAQLPSARAYVLSAQSAEPPGPPTAWTGMITYEARSPTSRGLSRAIETRPARQIQLRAIDAAGVVVGESHTDDAGAFSLTAPSNARSLLILAEVRARGNDAAVTVDALGNQSHRRVVPLGDPSIPLTIAVSDAAPDGFAGALHLVDTLLLGLDTVHAWVGRTLPPVRAYWGRGVTTRWSYYHGERPSGSGRYMLELLGGQPGLRNTTDTDEHDEAIVLHELGHFVMDQLTTDSSPGGDHPQGNLLDPGLVWEEGRATWFAGAVMGRHFYQDTIGDEPIGSLRIDHDIERGLLVPRGIGSQESVSEVLWDLSDGVEGQPDLDNDGVALGPAAIMQAMIDLAAEPGAYPCIATFLRFVVSRSLVTSGAMKQLLIATGQPVSMLPETDDSLWPIDLAPGASANGKVDGFSHPAPSGGPNRPANGVDAQRVYRIKLAQRGTLTVRLQIFGSGRGQEQQDLDMELRDLRANVIARSNGETPIETIVRTLDAGYYIVYVRDGGNGNRVGFEVQTQFSPVP